MKQVSVFAPASIGNISVGFDVLGAAVYPIDEDVKLGDRVTVSEADKDSFELTGPWAHKLKDLKGQNLVEGCRDLFFSSLPSKLRKPVKIELYKNMPVGSGLGSSASSVVAALSALNQYFDNFFPQNELLLMMGAMEGKVSGSVHYDNVAPAYLGGIQLVTNFEDELCVSVPHFHEWYWVLAYPGISLATAEMRAILPKAFNKETTIEYGRNLASFVQASFSRNQELAFKVLKDVLAEPYRKSKIPNYEEASKKLVDIGIKAVGISGSGPTLFAVTNEYKVAVEAKDIFVESYLQTSEGFTHICKIV